MFGKLGQLASLMGNLPKITAGLEKLQERVAKLSAEGDAGGGMVRVKVTGQCKFISCTIAPEALAGGDRELLEDLIVAAANQAIERARQLAAEETSKMAQEFGVPPGITLPGMG
jgi:DNA-binding YbaB/EbfC family protein